MAPSRKRRGLKCSVILPPTSTHARAVNTRGVAALADEIYLEVVSHFPSVPIPTSMRLKSYPSIRRSRHETFLSLSQTCRSLRRFFWRWQYILVREGMKIGNKNETLKETSTWTSYKKHATELVRQLEVVTIRNPQLAQYVKWVFELFCASAWFTCEIVTLTYLLANIQSIPSFLNWHVVCVYSQTYILSRSTSI